MILVSSFRGFDQTPRAPHWNVGKSDSPVSIHYTPTLDRDFSTIIFTGRSCRQDIASCTSDAGTTARGYAIRGTCEICYKESRCI